MKKTFSILLCVLAATAALAQTPHKYGIKCAIVKTVTENSGGQKSYTTLWFDDYGAKERSEVTMDMGNGMGEAKWEEHVKQILHTATVTSWVWKGIPIKYTVDNPRSTTTLVSLEQKSSLPASLFTVPK